MARRKLERGQHSIDTVSPGQEANGSYVIQWSIRLWDGKLLPPRKTRGRTIGEARRKAKAKAAELLLTGGNAGRFTPTSKITDYIDAVTSPLIKKSDLREGTIKNYLHILSLIRQSFEGYAIADSLRFRTLEAKLQNIAENHGTETARQARNLLSKYVIQQLIRDDLTAGNPLTGMKIDLGTHSKKSRPKGAQALTTAEYDRVLEYFLNFDPSKDVEPPKRGPYTLDHRINVQRAAVDLTLLQMGTGLRIGEARQLTWENVDVTADLMEVTVTPEISKTKRGRRVPVLDQRITAHLLARKAEIGGTMVIGAPADPNKIWDQANAQKAVRQALRAAAAACNVPLLGEISSHVWRATLNGIYLTEIPEVIRAAYFGHTPEINRKNYTDLTDTSRLVTAARARRKDYVSD